MSSLFTVMQSKLLWETQQERQGLYQALHRSLAFVLLCETVAKSVCSLEFVGYLISVGALGFLFVAAPPPRLNLNHLRTRVRGPEAHIS